MKRRVRIKTLLGLCALTLLAACTTCLVASHVDGDDTEIPPGSFPYSLPKTIITTVYTVTLTNCDPAKGSAYPSLNLKVSATATPTFEADSNERYFIDYQKLENFFKSTNIGIITASDSSLLSVNAARSDQTLQIAAATLQTGAAIVGAAITGRVASPEVEKNTSYSDNKLPQGAVIALPPVTSGQPAIQTVPTVQYKSACSSDAIKAVKALTTAQTRLHAIQATQESSPSKQAGAAPASDPNPSSSASAASTALSLATTAVQNARDALTVTVALTVEPKPSDFKPSSANSHIVLAKYHASLLGYIKDKWVDPQYQDDLIDVSFNGAFAVTETPPDSTSDAALARDATMAASSAALAAKAASAAAAEAVKAGVATNTVATATADAAINAATAAADAASAASAAAAGSAQGLTTFHRMAAGTSDVEMVVVLHRETAIRLQIAAPSPASAGIVVREPARGIFRTCLGQCQAPDQFFASITGTNGINIDLQKQPLAISVPQLGRKLIMPLHNHIGQDMNLTLAMGADGSLLAMSFQDSSTIAASLTAVGNAATTYMNGVSARNTAIAADNTATSSQAALATTEATLPDLQMKSLVDCYQQQQTLILQGRTDLPKCQ